MLTTNIRALKSVSEAGAEFLGRRELDKCKARLPAGHDDQLYQRARYEAHKEALRQQYPPSYGGSFGIDQSYGIDHRQNFGIAAGAR